MQNIKPGIYEHFKGKQYRVLGVGKHTETMEDLVVYEALYDNKLSKIWCRPASMFTDIVEYQEKKTPRFKLIKEE